MKTLKQTKQELYDTMANSKPGEEDYENAKKHLNDILELEKKTGMSDTCKAACITAGATLACCTMVIIAERFGPLISKGLKFIK